MSDSRHGISRQIRLDVFDGLRISQTSYCGKLSESDFLGRLYDLSCLPSENSRHRNAAGDIITHRETFDDWPDDWIFSDSRFELLTGSDEIFLRFLAETIHPVVRPDVAEAQRLLSEYNETLHPAGWQLSPHRKIAGRSSYIGKPLTEFHSQIKRAELAADVLSSNWMQGEIARINQSIDSDPASAIGTAKDLIESCCKAIIEQFPGEEPIGRTDDLPKLSKRMCKLLGLVPEGIPDEAKGAQTVKRTLSNLAQITQGIAELRGLYGSGHGRDGRHTGLEPRHARLAAACAIAFVDFVTETYKEKSTEN